MDYEGGNNANDGSTFALRFKDITLGATISRIAPGDTIRVMASPPQASLGIAAQWTDGPHPAGTAPTSTTNTTPIVVNKTAHGRVTGDTIYINGHTTNTNANGTWSVTVVDENSYQLDGSTGNGVGGASGTVTKINSSVVKLASALTQNIASFKNRGEGRVAWTASASVTATLELSNYKCADASDSILVDAAFGSGLAAYFPTGALDLSGYKQISFWIRQNTGVLSTDASLRLCSDAAGLTAVHIIAIPSTGALGRWMPVTVNVGVAMSASINSIGFVINTDSGAQTFFISNIIACKDPAVADSLSLTSLIGKNTTGETFYGIQSINGTRVILDASNNVYTFNPQQRGYSGVTESVTTYKRETIKTPPTSNASVNVQTVQDTGSVAAGSITFSGGWNRTDMSTQTEDGTWFDGQSGYGAGLLISGKTLIALDKLHFCRYDIGILSQLTKVLSLGNHHLNNCGGEALNITTSEGMIAAGTIFACNNYTSGISHIDSDNCSLDKVVCNNNGYNGVSFTPTGTVAQSVIAKNNYNANIIAGVGSNTINGGLTSGNTIGVKMTSGRLYLRNFTIGESPEEPSLLSFGDGRVVSTDHDGVVDQFTIFCDGGLISSQTTIRHTAAGRAWSLQPQSTNRSLNYPLDHVVARIAVSAGTVVTVKCWLRRTNAGVAGRLTCKGGQLSGIAADVVASMSAAQDVWQQVQIVLSPTQAGIVQITAEAYGGTTYTVYADDLSVSAV